MNKCDIGRTAHSIIQFRLRAGLVISGEAGLVVVRVFLFPWDSRGMLCGMAGFEQLPCVRRCHQTEWPS